jgi:hypothetical protein
MPSAEFERDIRQFPVDERNKIRQALEEGNERGRRFKEAFPMPTLPINHVPMKEFDRIGSKEFAQNRASYNAMAITKPLKPNTLDAAADAAEAARAKKREGSKWVKVLPGR